MANPASPRENNDTTGTKLGYLVYNNGGSAQAVLPRGVNAAVINTETTKSGSAAVASMVEADAADPTAEGPIKIGGRAQDHTAAPAEVSAANDRVAALMDRVGRIAVYQGYVLKSAVINCASSGDNTLVAAVANKKIRVLAALIISDGTVDTRFESGASGTALTGQMPLSLEKGYFISNPWGLFEAASNTLLNLELSAAINVHGFVTYIEVDD